MNVQKLLHPLINHMHEVLQQVNYEEYIQKPSRDPKAQYPQNFYCLGIFSSFLWVLIRQDLNYKIFYKLIWFLINIVYA